MEDVGGKVGHRLVAPLAGSVDRNIRKTAKECGLDIVAPLAGSVDRNAAVVKDPRRVGGRSPRGERG